MNDGGMSLLPSLFPVFATLAPLVPPSSFSLNVDFSFKGRDQIDMNRMDSFVAYLSIHKEKIKGIDLTIEECSVPDFNRVLSKIHEVISTINLLCIHTAEPSVFGAPLSLLPPRPSFPRVVFSSLQPMPLLTKFMLSSSKKKTSPITPSCELSLVLSDMSRLFPNLESLDFYTNTPFSVLEPPVIFSSLSRLRDVTGLIFNSAASSVHFCRELTGSIGQVMDKLSFDIHLQLRPSADRILECPELASMDPLEMPAKITDLAIAFDFQLGTPEHKKLPLKLAFPKRLLAFPSGGGRIRQIDLRMVTPPLKLKRAVHRGHSIDFSSCLGPLDGLEKLNISLSELYGQLNSGLLLPIAIRIDTGACFAEMVSGESESEAQLRNGTGDAGGVHAQASGERGPSPMAVRKRWPHQPSIKGSGFRTVELV